MAAITAALIKQVREETGAGMMDVKKALTEAEGDVARAMEIIRAKGIHLIGQGIDQTVLDFAPTTKGIVKEDVARANRLLDEAGWSKRDKDGIRMKDGVRLEPIVYIPQVTYFPRVSEAIQGQLRKVGVAWKITALDSTIMPAKLSSQDFDLWTVTVPYLSAGELMKHPRVRLLVVTGGGAVVAAAILLTIKAKQKVKKEELKKENKREVQTKKNKRKNEKRDHGEQRRSAERTV